MPNVPLKLRLPAAVIMCTESPYRAIQKRENVLNIGEQEITSCFARGPLCCCLEIAKER